MTPAIAIAEELLQRRPLLRMLFFVSSRSIDQRILATSGLSKISSVAVIPQPVESGTTAKRHPLRFLRALNGSVRLCRERLQQEDSGFLLGLGGFASVPAVLANRRLKRPIALLETNCVPGRANRLLNRCAGVTFTGWPMETRFAEQWRSPLISVGVPLRQAFRERASGSPPSAETGTSKRLCLLVLGGSQGSHRLNVMVREALSRPDVLPADWNVLHQTGWEDSHQAAGPAALRVDSVPFIDDMAAALNSATVVISRAGALSMAEIAAAGKPSILIPFSNAADQHQRLNAEYFAKRNAATVVIENDPDAGGVLAAQLRRLTENAIARKQMAECSARLSHPRAAAEIAEQILSRMVDTQAAFRADPRFD